MVTVMILHIKPSLPFCTQIFLIPKNTSVIGPSGWIGIDNILHVFLLIMIYLLFHLLIWGNFANYVASLYVTHTKMHATGAACPKLQV